LGKCGILFFRRYPSIFVRDGTAEERRHLQAGLRAAEACRVRRCQIVLASEDGAGVPRMFPEAVRLAVEGYHFEKVTRQVVAG
jgi:hypothetical protein